MTVVKVFYFSGDSLCGKLRALLYDGVHFAQFRPDIIITDWMIPDVSGVELCRQVLKAQDNSTYIILVTQKSEKEDLIEALDAGADDCLTKPFDAGELLATTISARPIFLLRCIRSVARTLG